MFSNANSDTRQMPRSVGCQAGAMSSQWAGVVRQGCVKARAQIKTPCTTHAPFLLVMGVGCFFGGLIYSILVLGLVSPDQGTG